MLQPLKIKPGVNRENTKYTNEGGWWDMDKVRFRSGTAEQVGGWVRATSVPFTGICRHLRSWMDLSSRRLTAIGTDKKFYIEMGGSLYDVTPVRLSQTSVVITVLTGVATVSFTSHNASTGDYVEISSATLTALNGESIIASTPTSDTFTFPTAAANGTYTATVDILVQVGNEVAKVLTGYGVTGYGGSTTPTTVVLTNPFTAVGTAIITVAYTGAITAGQTVHFAGSSGLTGSTTIDLNNNFTVQTVTAGVSFTINYAVIAPGATVTAAAGVGGTVTMQIDNAAVIDSWGNAGTSPSVVPSSLRVWVGDNFGEGFIYAVRDGGVYYWGNGQTVSERGKVLSSLAGASKAPTIVDNLVVTEQLHVMVIGTNKINSDLTLATYEDPLLVRWSASGSVIDWDPLNLKGAGDFRLSTGSYVYAVKKMRNEVVVWTDTAVIAIQYRGYPIYFAQNTIAENISVTSINCVAVAANVAYWMGQDKFYTYDGVVRTLSCDVRKYVFGDMNKDQIQQIFAHTNEAFNEVSWHYCSAGSTVVNRYVTFNYLENLWTYGTYGSASTVLGQLANVHNRSSWIDSPLHQYPLAAGYDGYLYYHENGTYATNGAGVSAIGSFIESAPFDIADGDDFMFVSAIIPDLDFSGSSSYITPAVPAGLSRVLPATTGAANFKGIVSPDGLFVYTSNAGGNTVSQYSRNPTTGVLTALTPATVATTGTSALSIGISPDGLFIYVIHDTGGINTFARNTVTGLLSAPTATALGANNGRGLVVTSQAVYATARGAGTAIFAYSRNPTTGALTVGTNVATTGYTPDSAMAVSPDGKFLYVGDSGTGAVWYLAINALGAISLLGAVQTGAGVYALAISPDGNNLYVAASVPSAIYQFSLNKTTGQPTALAPASVTATVVGVSSGAYGIAVSASGLGVYVGNGASVVLAYDRNVTTGVLSLSTTSNVASGPQSMLFTYGTSLYVSNISGLNAVDLYNILGTAPVVNNIGITYTINAAPTPGGSPTLQTKPNSVLQTTVSQFTERISTRIRGRQVAVRLDCTTPGVTWQMGTFRLDMKVDGKR